MALRVLFVCLGNICRSPAAEGVFRHLVDEAGLSAQLVIDSAGTGSWHIGEQADARMREVAGRRGISLGSLARQVTPADFEQYDLILAMDGANLKHLRRMAPPARQDRIRLFRDFDPDQPGADVPDPYYGGEDGFTEVLDIVTRTSKRLLESLQSRLSPEPDPDASR
jgi:protein-tyrosine phosphatase